MQNLNFIPPRFRGTQRNITTTLVMCRAGVVAHFTSAMGIFVSGCYGSVRTYAVPSLVLTMLPRPPGLAGASSNRICPAFASRNPACIASTTNPCFAHGGCGRHYYKSSSYQSVGKRIASNKRPHPAGSPSWIRRPEVRVRYRVDARIRSFLVVLVFVVDVLPPLLCCCAAAAASILHEVLVGP